MTTKNDMPDINALAIEACDMWQEHLSNFANDPAAREQLTRFLEPQRRLFADWAAMMQQGGSYGTGSEKTGSGPAEAQADESQSPGNAAAPAAATGGDAHGDDALRVAQLALRLAELERRVAELESSLSFTARSA